MTALLNRIHARVGDLWWYSAMLFVACRSGDVIQAFIGLWLVPKYVGPNELGAVLPLQQLSSFFTVPLAIVAVVFSKYVNTYATRGERGKVKSFIHDVIIVSAALFLVCIAAAYWLIPHFYSRLNIAAGSLTILVLASGFVGNISNLFGSALQGLKKFRTMTVQNLIGAPIRLITLLVAMPFRPLSGFLLGQTTPSASCGILAAWSIHRDLKSVQADNSWRKDIPRIWQYLWPIAIFNIANTFFATISITVYRQRLPEVESSAYYMLSRFSEIAGYLGSTLGVVLFPLVSEAHESGKNTLKFLTNSLLGIAASTALIALTFFLAAPHVFRLTQTWSAYKEYDYLLSIMSLNAGLAAAIGICSSHELARRNFGIPGFLMAFGVFWTIFLVSFTGYEFYRGLFPDMLVNWMRSIHLDSLPVLTWANLFSAIIQITIILYMIYHRHNKGFGSTDTNGYHEGLSRT